MLNEFDYADGNIENKIFFIRGKRVIMDTDLSILYGVATKRLNESVKRNVRRFPEDFMFQLDEQEVEAFNLNNGLLQQNKLRSQIATSKGGRRYRPFVFTELGVAMLSSVLKSERAIQVNIQIMRTFIKLRQMLASNKYLREKIEKLEKKYDNQFNNVFKLIKDLLEEDKDTKPKIGFNL